MPKRYFFDKPYSTGDGKHLVIPLIVNFDTHWEVIPLEFLCEDRCDFPDVRVYYDDYDDEFHIVIPNAICSRWPLPICEESK